jgi:hypothetical protein
MFYSCKVKLRDITQEHCERPAAVSIGIFQVQNFLMPRLKVEDNIKIYLQEIGWRVLTGFIWIRIGTRGTLL